MSRSSHVDSNSFSIGASRLAKALNRLIETPPAVETEMVSEESVVLDSHLPVESCRHQLTEIEIEYYQNHPNQDRLCKRCAMEERAR